MDYWRCFKQTLTPWLTQHLSGAGHRERQHLTLQNLALSAECDQWNRDMKAMHCRLRLENRGLQQICDELRAERDDLQLEIWELEELIEELLELLPLAGSRVSQTSVAATAANGVLSRAEPAVHKSAGKKQPAPAADLAGIKLALVGGHESIRRGVLQELSQRYGLTQWVELPPFSKHSLGRRNMKSKIQDCNLVVVMTGYMKHKQTDGVMQLKKLKCWPGEILLLSGRGKSGTIREILAYIGQKNC